MSTFGVGSSAILSAAFAYCGAYIGGHNAPGPVHRQAPLQEPAGPLSAAATVPVVCECLCSAPWSGYLVAAALGAAVALLPFALRGCCGCRSRWQLGGAVASEGAVRVGRVPPPALSATREVLSSTASTDSRSSRSELSGPSAGSVETLAVWAPRRKARVGA